MAHMEEGWFASPEGGSTPRLEPSRIYRPSEADEALDGPGDGFHFELAGGGTLLGNAVDTPPEPEPGQAETAGPPVAWSGEGSAADLGDWPEEPPLPPPAQAAPASVPPPVEAEPPAADWTSEVPVEEGVVDDPAWEDEDALADTLEGPRDDAPDPAWAGDDPAWADDDPAWDLRPASDVEDEDFRLAADPDAVADADDHGAGFDDADFDAAASDDLEAEGAHDAQDAAADASGRVVRARPASYGAHALAWAVDGLVLGGVAVTLLWLAGRVGGTSEGLSAAVAGPTPVLAAILVAAVMGVFYTAGFTVAGGQTLGGRIAGVTVLEGTGFPPGLGRAFLRALLAVPGILLVGAGLAWVVVDEHGQSLHDRIARTWAVEIE